MEEGILFASVVRNNVVISSYGSISISDKEIIHLLPTSGTREQRISSSYLYSFIITAELTFVAVSQRSIDKKKPFEFLELLSKRWISLYGVQSKSAGPHSMDSTFSENFKSLFEDKTSKIHRQLDETQNNLKESVEKAILRGDNLNNLTNKTEDMLLASEEFNTQAANLKYKNRCSYIKSMIMRALILTIIVYIIISFICGGLTFKKCRK